MRYEPIKTNFCGQEFASIRVDDVDLYIVSQLPLDPTGLLGFQVRQNYAQRDFKRLLGNDCKFAKFNILGLKANAVCIDHDTLSLAVKLFARKHDTEFCWTLLEASFNTQLRLANDVARGIALEAKMYVEWNEERSAGIQRRREYTDYIQLCIDLGMDLRYDFCTVEVYTQTALIGKYRAWKKSDSKVPFRATLDSVELRRVADLESLLARVGTKRKLAPAQSLAWMAENL